MRYALSRNGLRYGLVFFPVVVFTLLAISFGSHQCDLARSEYVSDHLRHTGRTLDFRLNRLLELTASCAASPSLVRDLDLGTFEESCGPFAEQLGAWVVVVETGETHRQIVNTRADAPAVLPVYPRTEEVSSLLALERRSRVSGGAEIADVFPGRVHSGAVLTSGQAVDLPDGRSAMVYVGIAVGSLSDYLEAVSGEDITYLLVDSSQRVVARSADINAYLFSDASALMQEVGSSPVREDAVVGLDTPIAAGIAGYTGYRSLDAAPGWILFAISAVPVGTRLGSVLLSPSSLIVIGMVLSGGMWLLVRVRDRLAARLGQAERARLAAERANREKSRLLASFAHDIRNPLISLLGSLELSDIDNSSRSDHLEVARSAAEALLQMVDDILELSHIGSGEFTLHASPVDLRCLAENVIDHASTLAGEKGLDLTLECTAALPAVVEVDRLRLQQVLGNLVMNGVKYTDLGSVRLRISGQKQPDGLFETVFEVIDTGVGLQPEDIPRVLREFGRLDRESERAQQGVGLGLAICQRILTKMGSRLEIKSCPGEGSTFSFRLALPVAGHMHTEEASKPMDGLVVVYAEDEPVIRQVTANRLRAAGATVIEAKDGADALTALETVTPDLLLLDLQMPEQDGVETIRQLSATDPERSYPIFVLTSYIIGPKASEARAVGADAVFTKPGQIMAMAAALRARRGDTGRHTPAVTSLLSKFDAPFVDLENFLSVVEVTGDAFESGVLGEFEHSLQKDIEQLGLAIEAKDFDETHALAHKSLGLCSVMGATLLAHQLRKLEHAAEDGDLVTLKETRTGLSALQAETLRQMYEVLRETRIPHHEPSNVRAASRKTGSA